ncbi:MAG: IS4 family transposase [Bdellovibrionales bacterium]
MDCKITSYFSDIQHLINSNFKTECDNRAKISSKDFLCTILMCFQREGYRKYIESLNRYLLQITGMKLSRSAFWERLSTKSMQDNLINLFMALIAEKKQTHIKPEFLKQLNVRTIYALDASTISLPSRARKHFKGTRTNKMHSAIKWQCLYNLVYKTVDHSKITGGTANDYNFLPTRADVLKGSLILFDLAYVGKKNLKALTENGVSYLCRLRFNTKGFIIDTLDSNREIKRILKKSRFGEFDPDDFKGKYVGRFIKLKVNLGKCDLPNYPRTECFVTATWNEVESRYHWYVTNMDIDPKLSYPTYRLRWQIELFFKATKSYLNLGNVTTANPTIILNLVLISQISYLITMPMIGVLLGEDVHKASILRVGIFIQKVSVILIQILSGVDESVAALMSEFNIWREHLFDPNSAKRQSSIIQFNSIITSV